jgi:hypothetical protein
MKEVTKERTKVEKYTVYQAIDGTEFNTREECQEYDNSAKGVLRGKLKDLIVNDEYNGWALMGGNEDHNIIAVKVPTETDIDIVLQNYYLDNPWILEDGREEFRNELILTVNQAYREQDVILFGINCDADLYCIDTRKNIIDRLNKLDRKEADNAE